MIDLLRVIAPASLCLLLCLPTGCKGGGQPVNPFAQNRQIVPPPATFSSQESYLGQTPGAYVPQTPASTFPSGSVSPPAAVPANVPATLPPTTGSVQKPASLFSAEKKESGSVWTPAEVTSTSQTAFQAMEAKVNSVSYDSSGIQKTSAGMPESLLVGTSLAVTTIAEESKPGAAPAEPQLLYSGKYGQ